MFAKSTLPERSTKQHQQPDRSINLVLSIAILAIHYAPLQTAPPTHPLFQQQQEGFFSFARHIT